MVQAVGAATLDLIAEEDWARVTLARIADRAGVHPATVYRRWDSLPSLVGSVLAEHWREVSPLPDRGSLAADVHAYARRIAADLAGPEGRVLLRGAVLIGSDPEAAGQGETLGARNAQLQQMLDRAAARGESPASALAFFECVTAPLYGYALFAPAALPHRAAALADRFLAESPARPAAPG